MFLDSDDYLETNAFEVLEKYIDKMLECIENQTYNKIEILCIDDASHDSTPEILRKHAEKDSRYRLILKDKNEGLSVSRNIAIDEAKGKYILMLDGDDMTSFETVERAYRLAEKEKSDMVLFDYAVFYDEKELNKKIKHKKSVMRDLSPSDRHTLIKRPAFMHTRLYNLNSLRELGIRFTKGLTKQDIPIHWKTVTSMSKIAILPEIFSYYRQQPESTSNKKGKSVLDLAYVMDIVLDNLRIDGLYDEYKNEFMSSRLQLLQGMYDVINNEYKDDAFKILLERFDTDARKWFHNNAGHLTLRSRLFYDAILGSQYSIALYKIMMLSRTIYRKLKL